MIEETLWITNRFGEKLEALIRKPDSTGQFPAILFVSGLGMDLHEYKNSFDEISQRLITQGCATVQFSFSGCGNSEGKYVEMTFTRQGQQIDDVLSWLEKQSFVNNRIGIIAQSCGVASTLNADISPIKTLLFVSGAYSAYANLKRTFTKRNAYNPTGISSYPRSSEKVNEFGPQFWQDLERQKDVSLYQKITAPVFVAHGTKENYIPPEFAKEAFTYFSNPKSKLKIYEGGDHGIINVPAKMREEFLQNIVDWFKETL